jgi:predicted transposase YbfD/YdcC
MANGLSQIIIEKLDKNNLPENPTQQQIQANKTWHEKARKILYWLSVSVSDSMIVHIQDAKSPKQAWNTLVKMYNTNTQARKMQLKQEVHNLQKNKMNMNDYFTKVKNLADAFAS